MNYTLTGRTQGNKWKVGDEVQVKSSYEAPQEYWRKRGKITSFFEEYATVTMKDGKTFMVKKETLIKDSNE